MKRLFIVAIIFVLSGIAAITYGQFQNIRVNNDTLTVCNEPSIALNPTNPDNIVIGVNNTYFMTTFDEGNSWTAGRMFSSMGVWGDPSLAFDQDGNLYFGHLSGEPPLSGRWVDRIIIQKSTDGGLNWDNGHYTGLNRPKYEDKDWISVDMTNSIYKNNLYIGWTEFDTLWYNHPDYKSRIMFSRSTDAGETWSTAQEISDIEGNCMDDDSTTEGAIPAIGPNGEVYIAWAGPEGIVFDRSFDGGVTFGDDIFVTDHVGGWGWGYEVGGFLGNGLPQTVCDISNSPYRGNIYILWADQRNGTYNPDILLKKSIDKGLTWSETKIVNDDKSGRPQFFPWMSIDPITGIMYIVYYDRRNTISNMTDVYVARSTDGGETFYNFLVSESSFEATTTKFIGDYINIVAYNGKAYPVWIRSDQLGRDVMIVKIDESTLDVKNNETVSGYNLSQNYPNPFNPSTTIKWSVPEQSYVTLKVYDLLGKEIAVLVDEEKLAGNYEVNFDATNLSSGVYFYRLKAGSFTNTKKFTLLK